MPVASPDLDLPLADTPASRFLTWIMGGLTGLAVLALAVAAGADAAVRDLALRPSLATVALPASADPRAGEAETARAVELLRRYPGVAYAAPVAQDEVDRLVEPWLGGRDGLPGLALPRLIDVSFNPGAGPDLDALSRRLEGVAPGARVEAAAGGDAEAGTARALRLVAGVAGLAVLAAMAAVVAVVTRLSLDLHAETVDLLRLMGAADGYVARQFEQHALASGLRGGLAGFSAGVLGVVAFILLAALLPRLGLPEPGLRALDWVLLAGVPVVAALLTTLAARLAAARGLARLR